VSGKLKLGVRQKKLGVRKTPHPLPSPPVPSQYTPSPEPDAKPKPKPTHKKPTSTTIAKAKTLTPNPHINTQYPHIENCSPKSLKSQKKISQRPIKSIKIIRKSNKIIVQRQNMEFQKKRF
jgi:hypothetical protein